MSNRTLQIYQSLPYPLRSFAASARGYYLRAWRYGPETEKLAQEALEREAWSADVWKEWQAERLGQILHRAATQVPYYRELWAKRRRQGDTASWEQLENWPILEKGKLRENPRAFVADSCNVKNMFHEHTSGTSGKSLDLWWSRDTVRAWYALVEARCRLWHGMSGRDRWAILGGQLITPVAERKPPFWVWNAALNQLYMSSYHLAPDLIPLYLDALSRYRIKYLWGYSSSLYALAQAALRLERRDIKMSVVITNAEPLFPYQREAISEAFGCPVRETYGMAEIAAAASECPHSRMHLWPEVGKVEVLQDDYLALTVRSGDMVCTGLLNVDMPLIRYRIGDRATLPDGSETDLCPCGRTLPLFGQIEGRADDMLFTEDGRRIGRLDPVFKSHLPVLEAQIIQETLGRIRVRYVPAPDFTSAAEDSMTERLQARMGRVQVVLEEVAEVPRSANGKFRAVINSLSVEERARIEKLGW